MSLLAFWSSKKGFFVLSSLIPLFLISCTINKTGVQNSANSVELSQLQNLSVRVKGDRSFSVLLSASDGAPGLTGTLLLGVPGAAIESFVRAKIDQSKADNLRPLIQDIDFLERFEEILSRKLISSGRFNPSNSFPSDTGQLILTVEQWGLRPSILPQKGQDRVQIGFKFKAQIFLQSRAQPLWDWTDIFLLGKERPLVDYHNQEGLLHKELEEAMNEAAIYISNTVRYECR